LDDEPAPSVIAMGPADMDTQDAPLHDLNTHEPTLVQPTEFAAPDLEHDASEQAPDYYAESIAHADEAIAAFHQAAASHPVEVPVDETPVAPPTAAATPSAPAQHAEPEEEPIAFEIEPPGLAVAGLHEKPVFSDPGNAVVGAQNTPVASTPANADTLDAFAPYQPIPGVPAFEDDLSFTPPFSSRLVVRIGPFSATYEIDKPEYTIGRPDPKTGTSPDIALEWDDAVSRHHAHILRRSDGDYLEDVGSSNGTLLNGQPIAVHTPILLKDGDVITIGERTQISYSR
jgi:pSer/pThr/pTyr-binding forkhead associated (FHA) protein